MSYTFNVQFRMDESNEFARAYLNGRYRGRVYFKPRTNANPVLQLAFRNPNRSCKHFVRGALKDRFPTVAEALQDHDVLQILIAIVVRDGFLRDMDLAANQNCHGALEELNAA